jgi:exodeoxyribonuclease-3
MKIASFNANGVRARLPIIRDWLAKERPDILCMQETKVQDVEFPKQPFEELGYVCAIRGQKAYNGVAILSSSPLSSISCGFGDGDAKEETRLITATYGNTIPVVNSYIPQGSAPDSDKFRYKLDWLQRLQDFFMGRFDPSKPLIWVGDFNVAPEPIDVHDPQGLSGSVGFHPDEHAALSAIKSWGFADVFRRHQPDGGAYTFWDYRVPNAVKRGLGWRIDHIWATPGLAEKSTRAWIDVAPRLLQRPSDHTFIVAEFNI